MIRLHTPFNGKRLVGDKGKMIFHDSLYESWPAPREGCQIDRIRLEDVVTFDPDNVITAIKRGFAPCPKCLWIERVIIE
jgi:hypothetical protein